MVENRDKGRRTSSRYRTEIRGEGLAMYRTEIRERTSSCYRTEITEERSGEKD